MPNFHPTPAGLIIGIEPNRVSFDVYGDGANFTPSPVSAGADTNVVATPIATNTAMGGNSFTFCVDDVTGTLSCDGTQNRETCDSY